MVTLGLLVATGSFFPLLFAPHAAIRSSDGSRLRIALKSATLSISVGWIFLMVWVAIIYDKNVGDAPFAPILFIPISGIIIMLFIWPIAFLIGWLTLLVFHKLRFEQNSK